jgi:hypothetical protein
VTTAKPETSRLTVQRTILLGLDTCHLRYLPRAQTLGNVRAMMGFLSQGRARSAESLGKSKILCRRWEKA